MSHSDIPTGWDQTPLRNLAGDGGLFVDGDWVESKDQDPNGGIRLLQLADIGDGKFLNKSDRWINDDAFSRLRCTELRVGDVLIARMPDPLGRACLLPALPDRCITVVDVAALRVDPNLVCNRWATHTVNSPQVRAEISIQSSGTTRKRISRGNLGELTIPLPPLAEQRRIADKLDTVLACVDAVNDRLARIAPLLKRFRQSVLAAATSGWLTEDWRGHEGAANWPCATLGSVAKFIDYRGRTPTKTATGIPLITAKNVRLGFLSAEPREFIAESDYAAWMTRGIPRAGDVLITTEAPLGNVTLVDWTYKFALAQRLICLQFNSGVLGAFAAIALQSPGFQRDLIERATGTTVAGIKASRLKELTIPVPHPSEQAEIVRRVELLFAYADRLEARLQAAQTAADRLTPALLAKAFRGELVPQDPNDEPATELLKRLAAQRAQISSAASPGRGRGRKPTARADHQ